MTRDYKHRTSRKANSDTNRISLRRWLLAAGLISLLISFLIFLRTPEPPAQATVKIPEIPAPQAAQDASRPEPEKPRFEFYTILPEQEVEIPETEIRIRKSEEKQGKVKPGKYILQVASFRSFKDADRLKAELALQGIQSNIEPAKIDEITWNRVKIGPFSSMTAVDGVRKRLRLQHIDAIVISAK